MGSDVSSPQTPTTVTNTSHSSTLTASPTDQQSPSSNVETGSEKECVTQHSLSEDENLNVKGSEIPEIIFSGDVVGESDKEKLTKEHNEKEQLSPPPEALHDGGDQLVPTDVDVTDNPTESKASTGDNSMESMNKVKGFTNKSMEDINTAVNPFDNSVKGAINSAASSGMSMGFPLPADNTVDSAVELTAADVTTDLSAITVDIHAPWEDEDSIEDSALREALSLMDSLEGDSDSDSNSDKDVIVCDVRDNRGYEVERLRGKLQKKRAGVSSGAQ